MSYTLFTSLLQSNIYFIRILPFHARHNGKEKEWLILSLNNWVYGTGDMAHYVRVLAAKCALPVVPHPSNSPIHERTGFKP